MKCPVLEREPKITDAIHSGICHRIAGQQDLDIGTAHPRHNGCQAKRDIGNVHQPGPHKILAIHTGEHVISQQRNPQWNTVINAAIVPVGILIKIRRAGGQRSIRNVVKLNHQITDTGIIFQSRRSQVEGRIMESDAQISD